jgi:hypothetical protein
MTILCTVCGTANPEGTTYCEGCGVELSAATAPTPAATIEAAPEVVPQMDTVGAASSEVATLPQAEAAVSETPVSDTPISEGAVAELGAPTELAQEAAPVGGAFAEGTGAEPAAQAPVPEVAVSEVAVPEVAPSAVPVSEVAAAAPAAETPAPTPVLTGEAKLGIKKFGAPTGEFIPLQGERLVVGRFDASSGPVDIDLSGLGGQEHISRRHAELYREQGVWSVRDLGSTNGVYIKRKGETGFSPRLQEPATLADGDELAFGNLMLIFHQS